MKRAKTRRKTIVGFLSDAQPEFVSLVARGANQRPFHATKFEGAIKETSTMSKNRKTKSAPDVAVRHIVFDKALFPDADAVETYLTAKGYSDFEIREEGETFIVDDEPEDAIEGATRTVESTSVKGLSYVVGNLKKSEDGGEGAGDGDDEDADEADKDGGKPEGETDDDEGDEGDEGGEDDDKSKQVDGGSEAADPNAETAAEGTEEAKKTDTVGAVRRRSRKGLLSVNGVSTIALAAKCEELGDFLDERKVTAKAFSDTVSEYSGGVVPGLWLFNDAFMVELRKSIKTGKATETTVQALATEFAVAVVKMSQAFETIIQQEIATAKAENREPELDAVMDAMFGQKEESEVATAVKALQVSVEGQTAKSESLALVVQSILDHIAVAPFEDDGQAEQGRKLAGRKSSDADERLVERIEQEEEAEAEEEQRRSAKRLGYAL